MPRVQRVMRQTHARILGGDTHVEEKVLKVFEPSTEVIRRGKAGKPREFGKLVKRLEAEHQIITESVVYDTRPSDSDLLIPAIAAHELTFGPVPRLVASDAAFYSSTNEASAHAAGVTRVCIPNRATKSAERRAGTSLRPQGEEAPIRRADSIAEADYGSGLYCPPPRPNTQTFLSLRP